MSRVDYSELVEALLRGDQRTADRLLAELIPRLNEYLRVVMGATAEESQECVQRALLSVVEKIMQENIRDKKYIFSYLLTSCRHEYLHHQKYEKRFQYDDEIGDEMAEPAEQVRNLLDQERQEALASCLKELDESSRTFILHFINRPETTTRQASSRFDLSSANVRTKKSRLVSRLHECCMRKLNR